MRAAKSAAMGRNPLSDQTLAPKTVAATVAPANRRRNFSPQTVSKSLKEMAGTTGLEPATSDVTGLRSTPYPSTTCLCIQWLEGVMARQAAPQNAQERYI